MYFDPRPKERREDLFDRERELEQFLRATAPMTLIEGLRRTGKSSLILVGLKASGAPHIYIDARSLEDRPYISYADLVEALEGALNEAAGASRRLLDFVKRVEGVSIYGVSIKLAWGGRRRVRLGRLLDALEEWAEEEGEAVLVIDEAQELVKARGFDVLPLLAYAYDNLRHLRLIVSGSKAGLLARFLRLGDASSPLYGRYVDRIELRPFDREAAARFLAEGCAQYGVRIEEPEAVYDKIGGIPGWLALFGRIYVRTGDARRALEEALEEARGLIRQEFRNFLLGRETAERRYRAVIEVAKDCASWSEVKRALEAHEGRPINDAEVWRLLKNLTDYSLLEKRGDVYCPPDPLIGAAFD